MVKRALEDSQEKQGLWEPLDKQGPRVKKDLKGKWVEKVPKVLKKSYY